MFSIGVYYLHWSRSSTHGRRFAITIYQDVKKVSALQSVCVCVVEFKNK
jgi:hypothetical protein